MPPPPIPNCPPSLGSFLRSSKRSFWQRGCDCKSILQKLYQAEQSKQPFLFSVLCSRPFTESTLTALVNIFVGFLGAFILNYLAKRLRLQIDFAKVAFGLAGISTILMMMALNTYDRLWWVALGKDL